MNKLLEKKKSLINNAHGASIIELNSSSKTNISHHLIIFCAALIFGSIGHLATNIYLPAMPDMANEFHTSNTTIQLTYSVYLFSFCLIPLVIGPFSDLIGRRRPVLLGIGISLISTFSCMLANNIYFLIFARFFQGIGLGMVVSISRTILPDYFEGNQLTKYFSYMTMFMPLAIAIGPPLGGFIQKYSTWRMIFLFFLAYLTLILAFARTIFASSTVTINSNEPKRITIAQYMAPYLALLKNKHFFLFSFCATSIFMGISAYLTASPFLLRNLFGIGTVEYGWLACAILASNMVAGWVNSRLITIIKPKKILYIANMQILLAGILIIFFTSFHFINIYTFMFAIFIFFFAVPLSFANASSLALSHAENHIGAATALMITLQYLGGTLGSVVVSFTNQTTVLPIGLIFLIVGIIYFFTLLLEAKMGSSNG